jgi:hypothetical protein
VRAGGYFSKPKGVGEQNSLRNTFPLLTLPVVLVKCVQRPCYDTLPLRVAEVTAPLQVNGMRTALHFMRRYF